MKVSAYEELVQYQQDYDVIPVVGEIFSDMVTPISLLRKFSEQNTDCFLLESVEYGEKIGRYSFLGYEPKLKICSQKDQVFITESSITKKVQIDPLLFLKNLKKEYRAPKIKGLPSFHGGLVGYFSYEMFQLSEPSVSMKESEVPFYQLMLFQTVIVFDHLKDKILIIANMNAKERIRGYEEAVKQIRKIVEKIYDTSSIKKQRVTEIPNFKSNVSREQYYKMVEDTKRHIYEGDIFQGVISRRFEAEYHSSLLNTYRVMRTMNPSPYMYYIKCEDVEIAGGSPETMVKLVNDELTTFPVAGTRRRGITDKEDLELEEELLADEKELSEHNMLVDLARNDIGRLSKFGTVKVKEYKQIHRFSKVMHIASIVTGKIKEEKDAVDTVAAMLPAGTLSGAPKIKACEIISEIEPDARGVYGGAIGYIDFSGDLDVCIAIRTAVKKGTRLTVQAGAGIVADSVPENEYEECENKAKAVLEAIIHASEVNDL